MPGLSPRPRSQGLLARRRCLALAAAAWLAPRPAAAEGVNLSASELLALQLRGDGITLDFPSLADTGYAVPLRATIAAPEGLTIAAIDVFLPENPNTRALHLKLLDAPARFAFGTALRLAASQAVWVVATYSDGSRRGASAATVVTSSACFDAS